MTGLCGTVIGRLFALRGAVLFYTVLPPAVGIATAQEAKPAPATHASESHGELRPGETTTAAQRLTVGRRNEDTQEALCLMVESAAKANDLPLEFFARVIWQESRFKPDAIGPVTRNGKRAQGIAQFMPGTASERGLLDPLNPVEALPKAAEFLNELRNQFGNLGLAAAAYNAGPRRVQEWIDGSGSMPKESRDYVMKVTGTSLEDWTIAGNNGRVSENEPKTDCRGLIALLEREPNRFVGQLEQHVTRAFVKPWGVQVAAGFNRDEALTMYASAIRRLTTVSGHQDDPNFPPILIRARGTSSFYQVRIGTDTRREANELCNRIRLAGSACLVKRRGA
jgi:hypothetical protein